MFRPRSQAQESANIGADEGVPSISDAPQGRWVESAKDLIPPKPVPEVGGIRKPGKLANVADVFGPSHVLCAVLQFHA